jgi:signal transduction histidine kinase
MLKNMQMPNNQSSEAILKQLRHVAAMVMQAAEADTMEQLLQNIAHIARELIGARYAALGVPDHKGGLRYFQVSGMSNEQIRNIEHTPIGLGLLGKMMRDATPLRLDHMHHHPEAVGFPEGHPHMESFIGVPIKLRDQLYGIFYLTEKDDDTPFTEDDQWLLEIMSGYVALAIAEKNLQEQRRQLALMREREQIGMTLHDGVIQSIYALGMRLDLAQRTDGVSDQDIRETLTGLNNVIEDIRNAIYQLKDDNSDILNLRPRFQRILSQLYIPKQTSISFNFPDHNRALPNDLLDALELMTTECLSNVIRHANATHIEITISYATDHIKISIQDDGDGFDPNQLEKQTGLGLRNLQRRTRIHGGSLQLESEPGCGTLVEIQLPLT